MNPARAKRRRSQARSARRQKLRESLFAVLGGCCSMCKSTSDLEIHHVDGCTWSHRSLNAEHRLYRYLRELRSGVRLDVLCRSCNASVGKPELTEVPF